MIIKFISNLAKLLKFQTQSPKVRADLTQWNQMIALLYQITHLNQSRQVLRQWTRKNSKPNKESKKSLNQTQMSEGGEQLWNNPLLMYHPKS